MTETLVMEIGAGARTIVRAGALSEEGAGWRDITVDALAAEAGKPVVVVLCGTLVASHAVPVPDFSDDKLIKVLPGLMTERVALADEARHFAPIGPRDDETGTRPIALVSTSMLEKLLGEVQALGFQVVAVIPDYALLDVPTGADTAVQNGGRVVARKPDGTGFTAEPELASVMLADGTKIRTIEDTEWQRLLASAPTSDANLMQGGFGPRTNIGTWLLWFRRAGLLAAVAFLAWVGTSLYQAADNLNRADALHARAEARFREALPEVTRVVNMEAQMRRAIFERRQQGGSEFLDLSSLVMKAVAMSDTTTVESLRFDAGDAALVMSVSFVSFASGEGFKSGLQQLGLTVAEGGSRTEGNRVVSELTIRRPL